MTDPAPSPPELSPPPRRAKRRGRRLLVILGLLAVLFIAAELVARFYLGLGDPPLAVADPEAEYLFQPSQEVRRFGNRIKYNAYSMRSEDFPRQKRDPRERRVMIIGDSVINGGAQTDHAQLASTLLQQRLGEALDRPVIVGNISAGSWGPPNMLGYVRRFGLFDADVLVLVLSSHDYGDVPAVPFTPVVGVHASYPDRKPLLALQELVTRYLLPRLRGAAADASVPESRPPQQQEIERSLAAVTELIRLANEHGARVIVAQFWEARELTDGPLPGHDLIAATARQAGAELLDLGPALREAVARGQNPYRDTIHPNAAGQQVMADALYPVLLQELSAPAQPSGTLDTQPAAR